MMTTFVPVHERKVEPIVEQVLKHGMCSHVVDDRMDASNDDRQLAQPSTLHYHQK